QASYQNTEEFVFIKPEGQETKGLEADNEFLEILRHFKAEVENSPKLMPPVDDSAPLAKVTVEETQPGLKWAHFSITWDEMAVNDKDGTPLVFDSGDFKGQTKLKRETKAIPAPDVQEAKIGLHRDSFYGR
ncbi:MAG TPA: hypothetical protein PLZ56_12605, partial [Anaerolineae bacterium]|nr:hypothetical protein [Anaerolineae bacterium]